VFIYFFTVTRLMGGSAGGTMGHAMSNMTGLGACSVSDSKPMQFPLTQRRKRRVLFTQAQVSINYIWRLKIKVMCLVLVPVTVYVVEISLNKYLLYLPNSLLHSSKKILILKASRVKLEVANWIMNIYLYIVTELVHARHFPIPFSRLKEEYSCSNIDWVNEQ
jgi:hypothetical protein